MNKRKRYIKSCEVSELLKLRLGGYEQKVLFEGLKKDLPVVICLHGGPGTPAPFSVGCRGLFPEWSSNAIMVYWDQLGCGANNYKLDDNFKISDFTDMTCDLIKAVKVRFPENKLYIFGYSWGSLLALQAAVRLSEQLDGVLVWGQIVKDLLFCNDVFSAFDNAPKSVRAKVEKIKADGKNCDFAILDNNLRNLVKLIGKYTDGNKNRKSKPAPMGKIIKGLLTSPDYSFKDFKAIIKNGYQGNKSLWRELINIDLTSEYAAIKVPYVILQGDTDIVTPTQTVIKTVAECGNDNVTIRVVENSGHMPSAAAMEATFNQLCEMIK